MRQRTQRRTRTLAAWRSERRRSVGRPRTAISQRWGYCFAWEQGSIAPIRYGKAAARPNLPRCPTAMPQPCNAAALLLPSSPPGRLSIRFASLAQNGSVSLHFAASKGALDVVDALLAAGANPTAANIDHMNPLHLAAMKGQLSVMDKLLTAVRAAAGAAVVAASAPGAEASAVSDAELDAAVVEAVNVADAFGMTPLHFAAMEGHAELVEALLVRGSDPNAADMDGTTALHFGALMAHRSDSVRATQLLDRTLMPRLACHASHACNGC